MPMKEYFGTACIGLFVEFPEGTDREIAQGAELILGDQITSLKATLEYMFKKLGYENYKITVRSS